jgi:hypothetical protein
MGRLKGGANTEAEAETLTLAQLKKLITYAEWRVENVDKSSLRKLAFKRLTWLEAQRERVHGIAAPDRRLPARKPDIR